MFFFFFPPKPNINQLEKTNKDNILGYLEYVDYIFNNLNLDSKQAQLKIELEWYDFIKSKLENDDSKLRVNIKNIIAKGTETFNIKMKKIKKYLYQNTHFYMIISMKNI